MNELNFEAIGKNIREARIQKNYTQEFLANQIGVNVSHISNIENNHVKVSLTALVAICNALHITVDYILKNEYTTASAIENEILYELKTCDSQTKEKILKIVQILNQE